MNKENITFFFKDKDKDFNNDLFDYNDLIKEFDLINIIDDKSIKSNINNVNYTLESYSVNELQKICEYYDLLKNIKLAKYKKIEIINAIKIFELEEYNKQIVEKRKRLWGFMNELMADKVMKKYILWK